MISFKILSLDGGGTWALIEVMALQAVYGSNAKGRSILKRFDLVTANSGGSIVLAGLAADLSLQDILRLFLDEDRREEIFEKVPFYSWLNPVRLIAGGPRYVTSAKLEGLTAFLGAAFCQTDLPGLSIPVGKNYQGRDVRFLIPAFDYDRRRATFFRSDLASPASNFPRTGSVTIAQAIHASSTAPVRYFDGPASLPGRRFWDGGVAGYNNPVFAGVIEALAEGVDVTAIQAFSLGTGAVHRPLEGPAVDDVLLQSRERSSIAGDIGILGRSITDDPPDAASFAAHVVLRQGLPTSRPPGREAPGSQGVPKPHPFSEGAVVRLNPLIQPKREKNAAGQWDFPSGIDRDEFAKLVALELDAMDQDDILLIKKLTDAWIAGGAPNQAIRTNQYLECEIGQPNFEDGAKLMRART